jgi:cytochrome c
MNGFRPAMLCAFAAAGLAAAAPVVFAQGLDAKAAADLMDQYYCAGCHAVDNKMVGPAFRDVAKKYAGDATAPKQLALRVRRGGQGVWGTTPMPENDEIPDPELAALIAWILMQR